MLDIGCKVRVKFGTGFFNGRFYGAGWRVGTVIAHSTVGEAHHPGGIPTYDVTLRDGNSLTHCSVECVVPA